MTAMRRRFRVEAALAGVNVLLLLVTLAWREWIELVFRVDPDQGSGSLEWAIVALSGLATVLFATRARAHWKQLQLATR
jgi:hypothetical protein